MRMCTWSKFKKEKCNKTAVWMNSAVFIEKLPFLEINQLTTNIGRVVLCPSQTLNYRLNVYIGYKHLLLVSCYTFAGTTMSLWTVAVCQRQSDSSMVLRCPTSQQCHKTFTSALRLKICMQICMQQRPQLRNLLLGPMVDFQKRQFFDKDCRIHSNSGLIAFFFFKFTSGHILMYYTLKYLWFYHWLV